MNKIRFELNVAQKEALKQIALKRSQGINSGVVVLPTGTGKTYVSAVDAKMNGKKILYLAHQEQILRQARKSFDKLTNFETSFYMGEEKNISDATFSTIQTMTRNYLSFPKKTFDYIILDVSIKEKQRFISRKKILEKSKVSKKLEISLKKS